MVRLLETLQWVLDICGGSLPPVATPNISPEKSASGEDPLRHWRGATCLQPITGEGWKSTIRVRMLHAASRKKILERAKRAMTSTSTNEKNHPRAFYDPSIDGLPISQEDLAYTLAAFSYSPLYCLPKLGNRYDKQGAEAWIALWRHVGWYLGISEDILRTHFTSFERAEKFSCTCGQMLYLELCEEQMRCRMAPEPLQIMPPPTTAILGAIEGSTLGMQGSMEYRLAVSRYLLGDNVAPALSLPPITLFRRAEIFIKLFVSLLPYFFGQSYSFVFPPRGRIWEKERGDLILESLARTVRFRLGMRRSTFRIRTDEGAILEGVEREEAVSKDEIGMKIFTRRWIMLLGEMGVVLITTVMLCLMMVWYLFR